MLAEQRLAQRNREVLLNAGQEYTERVLEREFYRVNAVVARDLGGYPALHKRLSEEARQIDEYYRLSADVPPTPPAWAEAVATIAKIPTHGDASVARILETINETIEDNHRDAMRAYGKASQQRHQILKKMLPVWRRTSQQLDDVQSTITSLDDRSKAIDTHMGRLEEIRRGSDVAVRTLSSSSLTQFFISGLVLVIALFGGIVNFQLIALPMSEMVGGNSYIGAVRMSDVAALVIIMVEVAMGLFLMESLRITRLFPVIGAMEDQTRKRMLWASFTILLIMALVESSLAYMRDLLAADRESLNQALAGAVKSNAEFRWIPSLGQMVMGLILPFALTFVAVPLESFIHAARTVIGHLMQAGLRILAAGLHIGSGAIHHLGNACVGIYDICIFLPLRVETMLHNRHTTESIPEEKHHAHKVK
ncbi:MAG: hypothetical protein OEW08_11615 [Gammaproteobacteria bacterium]|nr:hypothetical protein [Gammaproteobacteria bacterium]